MTNSGTCRNHSRFQRQLFCFAELLPVFAASYSAAYWLRFEGQLNDDVLGLLLQTIGWVVLLKLLVFAWFRIDQSWGRYVAFHDLIAIGQAVTCCSLMIVLVDYIFLPTLTIPRSIVLIDWGAMIVGAGSLRALGRLLRNRGRLVFLPSNRIASFIVGVNDSGEALLRAIKSNGNLSYHVVGFIDDDARAVGTRIDGVPVVGTLEDTCELALRYGVAEVLITAGYLTGRQVRQLVEDGRRNSVHVKVLPSYEQLLGGTVAIKPRQVAIDDLLRRQPVQLDMDSISQWIDGRVLMVTGSAGSIGSEICRQLLKLSPSRIILVDRSENGQFYLERELSELAPGQTIEAVIADINDSARMESVFQRYRPDIVFHAAAYKHVPLMEANAGEAVKNIVLATRRLADMADRHSVTSFVMISTDKAVNPTSVMGACKQIAEQYVQALAEQSKCRFVTVRFGNVLDSAGSVVPIFREQIARGGPVTITHPEITRYFMTIPEASQLVIQAGAMGQGGEIFVLDMGESVRIVDLADDMIRLSGLQVGKDIEIEYIGLRPGEKLYEELHDRNEIHRITTHPKIRVAEGQRHDIAGILSGIEQVENATEQPNEIVVARLREVVPEYDNHDDPKPRKQQRAA